MHSLPFEKLDRSFRTLPHVLIIGVQIFGEKLSTFRQILKAGYDERDGGVGDVGVGRFCEDSQILE